MVNVEQSAMLRVLSRQRHAFEAARPEPLAVRRERLERCTRLVKENGDAFARAMSADFGHRSHDQSLLTDVVSSLSALSHARRRLRRWARAERRSLQFPLGLLGARAEVRYEPKGVVGIVSPWNFPLVLTIGPLAAALAAGNRAMIKPSEFTERTSALLAEVFPRYFEENEVAVILGGADVGQAFCGLPLDHLLFTGATDIGRHVLHAAADNLVPVTLELGGKSPVIVSRSARLEQVAERVITGKLMNAGQICLAPDYMLVPRSEEQRTIDALSAAAAEQYPSLLANDDYTSIINHRHRNRLVGLVDDATSKGASAVVVNPGGEDFAGTNGNKLPLTILTGVTDDMAIMQREIFGPVLPLVPYDTIDEAIAYVNARDRPLGLYYFGEDPGEREQVLGRTLSGGVTINDVFFHVAAEDLPFGGVGPSGMGAYHGIEGFRTFSHARAIYRQGWIDPGRLGGLRPPYGAKTRRMLKAGLR